MVFYLKVNRTNSYVLPNLMHWVETARFYPNADIYIVCDNPELKQTILEQVDFKAENIQMIESIRDNKEMNDTLSKIAVGKWEKIGQAHLTTFWHAKERNTGAFWNIDADDTFICLDPLRCAQALQMVEKYAAENEISIMGLDMWRSISKSEKWDTECHWSFGITYTDNKTDWISEIIKHSSDEGYDMMRKFYKNVDWFFTYLSKYTELRIETFYFENMKFAHFFDYFLNYPHKSGFYHWKEGKIEFPILKYCFGAKNCGEADISKDVIKFEMGIKDEEALAALVSCCMEVNCFYREKINMQIELKELMRQRNEIYLKNNKKEEIIIWGTGDNFLKNYDMIKNFYDLKYTCDSNPDKWGKEVIKGVVCLSPGELKERNDAIVIISVGDTYVCVEIIKKLLELGITAFDYIDNWINYIQGTGK